MKKKTINKITLFTALGLGVVLLASCTANFSSTQDKANIYFSYDMGTTRYSNDPNAGYNAQTNEKLKGTYNSGSETVYYWQDLKVDFLADNEGQKAENHVSRMFVEDDKLGLSYAAAASGIQLPNTQFWFELDKKVMAEAYKAKFSVDFDASKAKAQDIRDAVRDCGGQVKFNGNAEKEEPFKKIDNWTNEIKTAAANNQIDGLSVDQCPNTDFTSAYHTFLNQKVNNVRSTICIYGDGDNYFGNYGWNHNKISMTQKTWGYAWHKGVISGLIVYPIAWLTETFSRSFGGNGWGQLGSILCVTFIVRTFLLLVSLKSTIGQQKMQMLQPELNKIQAKYPNANTNAAQKQRLSQEQMALYKKNNIHPLGTLLVLVVQFPLFIGVWGAMQGAASLATDQVMNLYLSESIWNTLKNTTGMPSNINGWWTAFTLIILMSVAQFVSMKLPQWMQKAREKKMPKLTANPAQTKSQKQMKWFGYIMLVMIIVMGFTLPAGMGVYWLAGALFSIVQTVIMQFAMNGTFTKFGRWCKATWIKFISKFKKKEQN